MSRFLLATMGSLGDLHPYIAIAQALLARGDEVVIVAAEEYRSAVERAGVEFAPARPSHADLGDYQATVARIFNTRRGPERLLREFVMPWLRPAYEDTLRASRGADLLVSHPLTFTVQLIAHKQSLPWVSTVLSPLSFMSSYDPPVIAGAPWLRSLHRFGPGVYRTVFGFFKRIASGWEKPLRQFRQELGLPPLQQPAMFEGQFSALLNLALFDPQLAKPQPDWPQKTTVCGSALFEGNSPHEEHLSELESFIADGAPPIIFALGSSAVWVAGDFWRQAVAAAQEIGRRAVLITGPVGPSGLPAGVKAFPYLPYSKVFSRGAVVVHQAGIGTLSQALRAGKPQLILPLAFDQPDNAARAQRLGLARTIPFSRATSRRLASELRHLLSDPNYAERAGAVAKDLEKISGAGCAAESLIKAAARATTRSPARVG